MNAQDLLALRLADLEKLRSWAARVTTPEMMATAHAAAEAGGEGSPVYALWADLCELRRWVRATEPGKESAS